MSSTSEGSEARAEAAQPPIDVVVPAFNEESYIDECIDQICAQDYPAELIRIWIVDSGSSDETAARVIERAETEPRLHLVPSPKRLNAAQAVNLGAAAGEAGLIARVDAHTYLYPDYLTRAVEALAAAGPDVVCVGGQPEQVSDTRFGRAVALARGSKAGVGASIYTDRSERAYVDTVQAGVYRRSAFDGIGGFNTELLVGEDEELNWRLRQRGDRILLDTRVRFKYTTRSTWRALFRQYRNYGESRIHVVRAHPEFLRPYHVAPAALVGAFGLLLLAAPLSRTARRLLVGLTLSYGAVVLASGMAEARRSEPGLGPRVAAAIVALHMGYGAGMLGGVWGRVLARLGLRDSAVRIP